MVIPQDAACIGEVDEGAAKVHCEVYGWSTTHAAATLTTEELGILCSPRTEGQPRVSADQVPIRGDPAMLSSVFPMEPKSLRLDVINEKGADSVVVRHFFLKQCQITLLNWRRKVGSIQAGLSFRYAQTPCRQITSPPAVELGHISELVIPISQVTALSGYLRCSKEWLSYTRVGRNGHQYLRSGPGSISNSSWLEQIDIPVRGLPSLEVSFPFSPRGVASSASQSGGRTRFSTPV
jgi:hypothetical protein